MWIKICGIRDLATALAVAELGPQAIGLNFYARSPRVVAPESAAEIVQRLPAGVEPIGVFVNHSTEQILDLCQFCGIRTIQLHGDEPPEMLAKLGALKVIRAFRVGAEGLSPVATYLESCSSLGAVPVACLIDARVDGLYGGSGKQPPWDVIRRDYQADRWPPLILAGGLHPGNVRAAIQTIRPWGIDVAGGVESAVACKDPAMVREFIRIARSA